MEKRNRKFCWIRILKNVSYIIAPILCALIILSFISVAYSAERETIKVNKSYYETIDFANNYYDSLQKYVQQVRNNINNNLEIIEVSEEANNDESYTENVMLQLDYDYYSTYTYTTENETDTGIKRIYYSYNQSNFCFLIIDNKNKIAYTNVNKRLDTSTTEEIKEYLLNNNNFLKYEDKKLDTSINELSNNSNINSFLKEINSKQEEISVYTAILDDLPYYDEYFSNYWGYYIMEKLYSSAIYVIPISFILLMIMIPTVLTGIGKTNRNENIHLNSLDKLSIEIPIMISGILGLIGLWVIFGIGTSFDLAIAIPIIIIGLLICYMACIIIFETIVKRIKTHTLIKTTFAYWLYSIIKVIIGNMKLSIKIGIALAVFIICNFIGFAIISYKRELLGLIILFASYATVFTYILKRIVEFQKIKKSLEEIYKGNTDIKLNEDEFKYELKEIAIYINDIAGGVSNAIDEKLKSERLKTELITNVSHDIKTPLTSIINYIDLLKKEGSTDAKAQEYLTILDNKSQRLKKLTEDLVEASKASSGNLKLKMEKIEVNELIKQVSGEFEDKFKEKGLDEIITFSKELIYIKADSRYIYRVLENMYSNIYKYSLENTRVYIDIIENKNNVMIEIKNISKQKLNISVDELMQRFVRGDSSRNTEGSGLGLSIARSLVELQNGKFDINLDGDLFKVTIEFEKINN